MAVLAVVSQMTRSSPPAHSAVAAHEVLPPPHAPCSVQFCGTIARQLLNAATASSQLVLGTMQLMGSRLVV